MTWSIGFRSSFVESNHNSYAKCNHYGSQIARELSGVQAVLDGLLVDRPRRNILRHTK